MLSALDLKKNLKKIFFDLDYLRTNIEKLN